jgi:hypothetical protein
VLRHRREKGRGKKNGKEKSEGKSGSCFFGAGSFFLQNTQNSGTSDIFESNGYTIGLPRSSNATKGGGFINFLK